MFKTNDDISKADEIIIRKFFLLKEEEKFEKAFALLEPLSTKYPADFKIFFLLGSVLYQHRNFPLAKNYLQKATLLNPKHALSSLNFIHTLSNLNEWHTAFREIRRFLLTNAKNKNEHFLLIQELQNGITNFSTSEKAIIKKLIKEFGDSKH